MKYSTGDVILKTEPLVYAVRYEYKGKVCDCCLQKCDVLMWCPKCNYMYYCSVHCQLADWREFHQYECKILCARPKQAIEVIVCNLIRMCIKYQYSKATSEKMWMMYDGTQRVIENLISRFDIHAHFKEIHLSEITNMLNSFGIVVDEDTIYYRFGQIAANSITIQDETRLFQREYPCVAWGLYIEASIFDHSCRPNAICVFNGPMLTIKALTEIDTDKEKITICYAERTVMLTRDRRRAEIRKKLFFDCLCDICTDENYSDAPRDELFELIPRMRFEMEKGNRNEVQQVCRRVLSLIRTIAGRYSNFYIEYMLNLVEFQCEQIRKTGMRSFVFNWMTWVEFELCLRMTYGIGHPFYKACLYYREILMPPIVERV